MPHFSETKDLLWNAVTGQSTLSGDLLRLYRGLDRALIRMSREFASNEMKFPIFLPANELSKLDYFKSFPHLVTFPVTLNESEANLSDFASRDHSQEISLSECSPIKAVLTPAACYHFYIALQGQKFDRPHFLTTQCPCFRRESFYEPLRRQWSFSMREIVILGRETDVAEFMKTCEERVPKFAKSLGLSFEWTVATDPFFKPQEDPKYFAQIVSPTKKEMIFEGDLSIGSLNNHRQYFGETFKMSFGDQPASSSCLAFGLERWIFAILKTYGSESSRWPNNIKDILYDGI